ncbi:MAG: hypothetical protein PHE47_03860 [Oscillospiraceae bacterium]|nr:hypothetical protein [Oscillospiraceae bacterium]
MQIAGRFSNARPWENGCKGSLKRAALSLAMNLACIRSRRAEQHRQAGNFNGFMYFLSYYSKDIY